jgi:4-amino-4-deoxy-L-arabinose transferase-like glycosyltransferase
MPKNRNRTSSPQPVRSPAPATSGKTQLIVFAIAALLFLITRVYILFALEPKVTDVSAPYFEHTLEVLELGRVPYRDLVIEYPPVAWWAIYAPRLLDDRHVVSQRTYNEVYETYHATFRALMFLGDLGCLVMMVFVVRTQQPTFVPWAILIYTIITAIFAHLLYDRLDIVLLFLVLLWAYCWLRSLDDNGHVLIWTALAYLMLGLSISFKLVPIITVPFLLLAEIVSNNLWARLSTALAGLAFGFIPFAIQYAASGPGVFTFLKHHAERGIQLESLYSSLLMVFAWFGAPFNFDHSHGAFEASAPLAPAMKIVASAGLLVFLAALGLRALLLGRRYTRRTAFRYSLYVICGSVILSNVFSPQYLLWALPLMLLLAIELMPTQRRSRVVFCVLLIVISAMTTWIFPYNYFRSDRMPDATSYGLVPNPALHEYDGPSPVAVSVLLLRNLLYLKAVVWLGVLLLRRGTEGAVALPDGVQKPGRVR